MTLVFIICDFNPSQLGTNVYDITIILLSTKFQVGNWVPTISTIGRYLPLHQSPRSRHSAHLGKNK